MPAILERIRQRNQSTVHNHTTVYRELVTKLADGGKLHYEQEMQLQTVVDAWNLTADDIQRDIEGVKKHRETCQRLAKAQARLPEAEKTMSKTQSRIEELVKQMDQVRADHAEAEVVLRTMPDHIRAKTNTERSLPRLFGDDPQATPDLDAIWGQRNVPKWLRPTPQGI